MSEENMVKITTGSCGFEIFSGSWVSVCNFPGYLRGSVHGIGVPVVETTNLT